MLPLAPGETWSVSVFLQRFMPDLSPGTHNLGYSVKVECFDQTGRAGGSTNGEGVLSVLVLKTNEVELAAAIAELASRLHTTDRWVRRSAEEALLVANSPLVIPYLQKLMIGENGAVVRALAKFPGNPDAESIVLGVLRTGTIAEAGSALSVMGGWKYLVSGSDMETSMARGNSWLRLIALQYAEAVGSKALVPAVSVYAEDSDPLVAAKAKEVAASLSNRGQ
jgi:hypothetical protein